MRKSGTTQVAVRLQPEAIRRLDALKAKVGDDPTVSALGRVTRSTVLKLAIMRGLEQLEREYGGNASR